MIRVAIIGAGIGAEHLAGYRALPDRFAVATICDLDTDRAMALTGGDVTLRIVSDIAGVLVDDSIDLVDICLPPHLHAEVAIAALDAGKHVICEKPLARSLLEVDAIRDATDRSPGTLFPVFQYRFGPAFSALDEMVREGLAGPPVVASAETHWNRGPDYYAVPWRGTWAGEAGGAILGHAIHAHDLLCRYLGPVAQVQARLATRVNEIETEDCAAVSMGFRNGALATSSVTLGAARDETRLRFVFRDLAATSGTEPYAPALGRWRFEARDPANQKRIDAIVAAHASAAPGFAGYLAAVADHLNDKAGRAVLLEDGRASVELVTAIYDAARSGRSVALPLTADHPLWRGWVPEGRT
jgi:predicted dehydrogenase